MEVFCLTDHFSKEFQAYFTLHLLLNGLALVLTLNRKIHKAYNRVCESNFPLEEIPGTILPNLQDFEKGATLGNKLGPEKAL